MIGRLDEVVIDCHDPVLLAEFWQRVLGGYIVRQSHEWVALEPPTGITVSFQLVPEAKSVKNRVHLDIDVGALDEAVAATIAAGGTKVGEVVYDEVGGFQVMADPEGNEFCLINGPTAITA
ncbi:MAG TPA: VOC family protein [Ilumatobacteraceae bacterium]|nr:VOC family protein [Ilumatobacteraceae bacterium]HRB03012.1 VOC family protein [Ilumatobacteraceae bacterium]